MKMLASFNTPEEAHLLQHRLQSEGIPSVVRDEHRVSLDRLSAATGGGVKIDVADDDFAAAWALFQSLSPGIVARASSPRSRLSPLAVFCTVAAAVFVYACLIKGISADPRPYLESALWAFGLGSVAVVITRL